MLLEQVIGTVVGLIKDYNIIKLMEKVIYFPFFLCYNILGYSTYERGVL